MPGIYHAPMGTLIQKQVIYRSPVERSQSSKTPAPQENLKPDSPKAVGKCGGLTGDTNCFCPLKKHHMNRELSMSVAQLFRVGSSGYWPVVKL